MTMQTTYPEVSEDKYRHSFKEQDLVQAGVAVRVLMWVMLPMGFIDVLFHQLSAVTAGLLLLRGITLLYSGWLLQKLKSLGAAPVVTTYLLRWVVLVMAVQWMSNACTPSDYFGHYLIDIWGCLMIFIMVPIPLSILRIPVITFIIASLLLMVFKHAPYYGYSLVVAMMLPASAVTGHAIASYVHRYRRMLLSAEKELDRQTNIDPVTGVANWREFIRLADTEFERHKGLIKPMSILVLDIADFKKINEDYGSETGDVILLEVTRRIQRSSPFLLPSMVKKLKLRRRLAWRRRVRAMTFLPCYIVLVTHVERGKSQHLWLLEIAHLNRVLFSKIPIHLHLTWPQY